MLSFLVLLFKEINSLQPEVSIPPRPESRGVALAWRSSSSRSRTTILLSNTNRGWDCGIYLYTVTCCVKFVQILPHDQTSQSAEILQHCISDWGSSLAFLYLGISAQSFNLSLSALFMGLCSFDMLNIAKCKGISLSKPDVTFS